VNRLSFGVIVVAVLSLLVTSTVAGQQRQTIRGLFIGTRADRVELTAFAEATHGRRLRMAKGALEDVPAITPSSALRIFSSLPNWQPSGVVLGTAAVFTEDNSETRTLPFASRMINVFASEVRVVDLERPERVAQLLQTVEASGDNPGYVFVVMFSHGMIRYFPVGLAVED